jgi:hypothetical protein
VEFLHATEDRYPRWTKDQTREFQRAETAFWDALAAAKGAQPGEPWGYSLVDIDRLPERPPRCLAYVQCYSCESKRQERGYVLAIKEMLGDNLTDSLMHLLGKTWFGPEEARRLYYRYRNGGREPLPYELASPAA